MRTEVAQTIFEKVKTLPLKSQNEVLEIVEQKFSERNTSGSRPIWEIGQEISGQISIEDWRELPCDGSINHDHYLYGAAKWY